MLADFDMKGLTPLIAVFVIWVFKALSGAAAKAKDKAAQAPTSTDEQTRRVQDEIRRKIAERRGMTPPPIPSQPSPRPLASPTLAPRPVMTQQPDSLRRILADRVRAREAADAKRLADLRADKDAADAARDFAIAMPAAPVSPIQQKANLGVPDAQVRSFSVTNLTDDLRDPDKRRRAFVLREVLSAPVALR